MENQPLRLTHFTDIFCPVTKTKIHCSQIEGHESANLSKDKIYEFCKNKCPIYRTQKEESLDE